MLVTFDPPGSQSYQKHLVKQFSGATFSDLEGTNPQVAVDHTLLDLYVIDEHNRARRPYISTFVDTYTRKIV